MYRFVKFVTVSIVFGFIFPAIMFSMLFPYSEDQVSEQLKETISQVPASAQITVPTSVNIPVLLETGDVAQMDLEDYIKGVLLKEMPAQFAPEALKAQAVATRTYTLRRYTGGYKHTAAAVCTDPGCCQAFISDAQFLSAGGNAEQIQKIAQAVAATAGQVLYYAGELIEATYFSCSGGMTEAAVAVWGEDIPYLQATQSPGEEQAGHYTDSVVFTRDELESHLGITVEGSVAQWVTILSYTQGGGVERIRVGDTVFEGTDLRSLLGLRSTAFSVEPRVDSVAFHTKGYGHRVGMSQYGANAMAQNGSDFEQILYHYYEGTQLGAFSG